MNYLQQILPKTVSNKYSGPLIPLYVFYLITSISIARSLIHIFSQDGGAGSIATIPINDYVNGGKRGGSIHVCYVGFRTAFNGNILCDCFHKI